MDELGPYMRGWRGYFGFCKTPEVLIALTRWVRLRLRADLWRQWKQNTTASPAGTGRTVSLRGAAQYAGSGRGPRHLASGYVAGGRRRPGTHAHLLGGSLRWQRAGQRM
jgi:RNA-directed DNA polymerase